MTTSDSFNDIQENIEGTQDSSKFFEQIRKEVSGIQQDLLHDNQSIEETQKKLKDIHEQLLAHKIHISDKQGFGNTLDKLASLENTVEKGQLNTELKEVIALLDSFTKRDLWQLQNDIINKYPYGFSKTQIESRKIASNNLTELPDGDSNSIANRAIKHIKNLI